MKVIAYCPGGQKTKFAVTQHAHFEGYEIAEFCHEGSARSILGLLYAGDGLIVPRLDVLFDDLDWILGIAGFPAEGKFLISVNEGMDTFATPAQNKLLMSVCTQAIHKLRRARPDISKSSILASVRLLEQDAFKFKLRRAKEGKKEKPKEPRALKAKPVFPITESEVREPSKVTLAQAWSDFRQVRKLKQSTLTSYEFMIGRFLEDWLDKPLIEISQIMVENRHYYISQNHGGGSANYVLRILRSILNFSKKYEDEQGKPVLKSNRVNVLSQTRAWNREKPRDRHLELSQIKSWYEAVQKLKSDTAREYLQFILLVGCRASEAAKLQWRDVDLDMGWVCFRDTKNHKDLRIPVAQPVMDILRRRNKRRGTRTYVFATRMDRPYVCSQEIHHSIKRECGLHIAKHDLRRTYASVADSLRIPWQTIGRLLNHNMGGVTARYVIADPERFRPEVEAIAQRILLAAGVSSGASDYDNVAIIDAPQVRQLTWS